MATAPGDKPVISAIDFEFALQIVFRRHALDLLERQIGPATAALPVDVRRRHVVSDAIDPRAQSAAPVIVC